KRLLEVQQYQDIRIFGRDNIQRTISEHLDGLENCEKEHLIKTLLDRYERFLHPRMRQTKPAMLVRNAEEILISMAGVRGTLER
ncbi:MAG TPA: hypothetical protein PKH07_13025, partial [bacterium]|nr:hypothetical protein [bacterium]